MAGYIGPFFLGLLAAVMWVTATYAVDQRHRHKDRHEVRIWMLALLGCSLVGSLCVLILLYGQNMTLGRWLLLWACGTALYMATAFGVRYLLARMWNGGVDIT